MKSKSIIFLSSFILLQSDLFGVEVTSELFTKLSSPTAPNLSPIAHCIQLEDQVMVVLHQKMFFIKDEEIRVKDMKRERPWFFAKQGNYLYAFGTYAGDDETGSIYQSGISDDMGETWHDLTDMFTVYHESGGITYSLFMHVNWMESYKGRLYCDAGGGPNILYSEDKGFSWTLIQGEWSPYIDEFAHLLLGDYLYMGGEAPLDYAWIRRYQFSPDGLQIMGEFQQLTGDELGNRAVMEFIYNPETGSIFAGAEGAILRSRDGERFTYSWFSGDYDVIDSWYPYFQRFCLSGKSSKLIFALGSRRSKTCVLFYSNENGAEGSWRLVDYATTATVDWPEFLHELPNGDILLGTAEKDLYDDTVELTISKITIETDLEAAFPFLQYAGEGFWKIPRAEASLFGKHQPYLYLTGLNSWCYWVSVGDDNSEHYLWSASLGWLKMLHEPFTYFYSYRDNRFIDQYGNGI